MRRCNRVLVAIAGAWIALAGGSGLSATFAQEILRDYRLVGTTVYPGDELLAFAHQHVAAVDGAVTPERLAEALELVYREDGYMLAEVEIRRRADGGLDFIVHEGAISHIEIAGVDAPMFRAILGYLQPLVGQAPLRQKDFERAIMLANDLSGLSITTEITFPDDISGALLTVHGEVSRQTGGISIDNPPRELGDAVSVYASQTLYSLLLPGDMLRGSGGITSHFDTGEGYSLSGSAYYRVPLGASGLYGEAFIGNVIGRRDASGTFVDTELRGLEGGLVLGLPVLRDLHNYGYIAGEYRYSRSHSRGGGIDYESGVHAASGMILFGHEDDHGAPTRLSLIVTGGERAGSLPAGIDDGDHTFWYARAAFATSQPLYAIHHNLSLRLDLHGQITSARLPATEEFYLGDRYSLRGYRFAEASGDSGLSGTVELAHLFDLEAGTLRQVTGFAFVDFGFVRNNDPGTAEIDEISLASAGLGARFAFDHGLSVSSWVGMPLVDGVTTERHSPAAYINLTKSW